MECHKLQNGFCKVVTDLCGLSKQTTPATCERCVSTDNPQEVNIVTCGLAVLAIAEAGKKLADFPEVRQILVANSKSSPVVQQLENAPDHGPGSELAKLISWFYVDTDPCSLCKYRMKQMNLWGPDECEKRMETIMVWLRQSAKKRGIVFLELPVRILVKEAIRRARKHAKAV